MSLSGGLGEPASATNAPAQGIAPPATAENPGAVFPKSDPSAAAPATPYVPPPIQAGKPRDENSPNPPVARPQATHAPVPGAAREHRAEDPRTILGNPYVMSSHLTKLSSALSAAIDGLSSASSASPEGHAIVAKFTGWRDEVDGLIAGRGVPVSPGDVAAGTGQEGDMFTD